MNRFVVSVMIAALPALGAFGQASPDAATEPRPVKSLSSDQVAGYLSGDGMGLALAAELNHFPGPRHVLDMGDELGLTRTQRAKIVAIHDAMRDDAIRLGRAIVHLEAHLDSLFASGEINDELLRSLLDEIAAKQGELRFVHLDAHLKTKAVLSPEQVAAYERARGYADGHRMADRQAHAHR